MEFDECIKYAQSPKQMKSHENTLSYTVSNAATAKKGKPRLDQYQKRQVPFKLIKNFRQVQEFSRKVVKSSKNGRNKTKRKLSENREEQLGQTIKKQRKMTENIEIEGILQEQYNNISARHIFSEMEIQQDYEQQFNLGNQQIWCDLELQKMIPMEISEGALNLQSPLQFSSFRHINSHEDTGIKKDR